MVCQHTADLYSMRKRRMYAGELTRGPRTLETPGLVSNTAATSCECPTPPKENVRGRTPGLRYATYTAPSRPVYIPRVSKGAEICSYEILLVRKSTH